MKTLLLFLTNGVLKCDFLSAYVYIFTKKVDRSIFIFVSDKTSLKWNVTLWNGVANPHIRDQPVKAGAVSFGQ